MKITIKNNDSDMVNNLNNVFNNMTLSTINLIGNFWGAIVAFSIFVGALFAPIGLILCLTFTVVLIDFLLGVKVSIKNRGIGSFQSNKARNSLIKLFFYWLFIFLAFAFELGLGIESCFGPKAVFGLIGMVEVWSIASNGLILEPNLPIFKLFKVLFTSEIAKKLEITKDEVEGILKADIDFQENKKGN